MLSQFDLFLADDRILPMLTKALGKTFLKAKKQPVPIKLDQRHSLAKQVARARDSAFLVGSYGDCWAVKLANTAMTEDQVVENLMAGITAVVEKIPQKWKNIKTINIKSASSVALPVYSNIGDLPRPPRPPADKAGEEAKETEEGQEGAAAAAVAGGEEPGVGKQEQENKNKNKKQRQRQPRALIRQQLNKLKQEAKAEKAKAAAEAADEAGTAGGKRKKRAASENEEPNSSTAGEGDGEDNTPEAAGGKKVKGKPKSPNLKSPKAKSPEATNNSTAGEGEGKGEGENSTPGAAGGNKVNGKPKSPKPKSPEAKAAVGSAAKPAKRRRTAAA